MSRRICPITEQGYIGICSGAMQNFSGLQSRLKRPVRRVSAFGAFHHSDSERTVCAARHDCSGTNARATRCSVCEPQEILLG